MRASSPPDAATAEVLIATPATMPVAQGASADVSTKRDNQGRGSSYDDGGNSQGTGSGGQRLLTSWNSYSSQPPSPLDDRVPTTPPVTLPPGFQSPTVSDAESSSSGFRTFDCPMRLRVDDAFACYREDDRDWMDAWRTHQSCSASRHATLISHLYAHRELAPEFLDLSPRRSAGLAHPPDQRDWRQTDKLQILSWNPGPARGSDPSLLGSHLNGPWHVCDGVHLFVLSAACPDAVRHTRECHSSFSCDEREPFLRTSFEPFYDNLAQGQVVSAHCDLIYVRCDEKGGSFDTILGLIHLADVLSVLILKFKNHYSFVGSCLVCAVFSSSTVYTERTN